MEILVKTIQLKTKKEYYQKHFTFVNSVFAFQLSTKEIEVLSAFLSQDKALIKEEVFNPITRKNIREDLKLQAGGLGNHLNSMTKKKYLIRHKITGKLSINPMCLPEENKQTYRITFELLSSPAATTLNTQDGK